MSDALAREHRTVSRVTTILEAAGQSRDGVRLAGLASLLGAPKSSVHGLVKGLVATGYLEEQAGVYRLGPALDVLVRPARAEFTLSARRALENLQRSLDETAILCRLVGDAVVYVEMVESGQLIKYSAPLHRRRPLYPTSSGKCFLAHFSPRRRDAYLAEHVEAARRPLIVEELDRVREQGYAVNRGETVPDVSAAASPILVQGRVVACLAVAGPSARITDELDRVAAEIRVEAARVAQGRF
ncbi:IclR family transcriptional regulator [Cryptosporangium aurantiacum]|uniref:Transcriptional regulator, IclR family n=1 Tax=Cryptosporangium aurantiacum TaxID=134849 RepID=A0A1M7KG90_9ACTN|nr:IclR family transcriptional regulator [Cryptosporangium aurantiacum]SHM64338.1 transcriptional regulator, IclR family [Cryptosporangium aurantiacum]